MEYQSLSKRQNLTLTWWNRPSFEHRDGIICDGSIRSGKTIMMIDGFILWSMSKFNGQKFAICGKTIEGLRRNVITNMATWLEGIVDITERRSENKLIVTRGKTTNYYYLFGGKDEGSYALIQGITLAGVLFDEVALMPRSFVDQAMARCSIDGSKMWFNCNPENPNHWFYTEWVKKAQEKNILYLHFTMEDNPNLSNAIKKRYESLYTGVFYDRYILGKWVLAEGAVYPMFDKKKHIVPNVIDRRYECFYISCDYGTLNPFSAGLWGKYKGAWYRIKEYYYDGRKAQSQKTDEEYYKQIERLAGKNYIYGIIVDPSAASFIECIKRHGKFRVMPANNSVLPGIRKVATCLKNGTLLFGTSCKDCIREFQSYVWDEKSQEDRPKKENDHAMDDIRYFVSTVVMPSTGFFSLGNISF